MPSHAIARIFLMSSIGFEETMCSDADKLDDKAISTANLAKIYPSEKDRLGDGGLSSPLIC